MRRRRGRSLQSSTGVSHRDMVVQRKKWMLFESVPFSNAGPSFSYGLANLNLNTSTGVAFSVYNRLMATQALTYEEYRVRRVTVYAQPGVGYTNDRRIKSSIFSRVDVNSQPTAASLDNLNSVICSESSVNKTFSERSNVKLADYAPICYSTGGSGSGSRPILPSRDQWYNIDERPNHLWRGATVCPIITELLLSPGDLAMTLWVSVELDFRSRRPDFASLSLRALDLQTIDEKPVPSQDDDDMDTRDSNHYVESD